MKNSNAAVLVIVAAVAGVLVGSYGPSATETDYQYGVPTSGLTKAELRINYTTVHLYDECHEISFDVTEDQAYSIARGLEGTIGPRPLTHDIMEDIFDVFGIGIEQIRIDRYDGEIYYATIILRQGGKVLELDARPSDSIALAVRTGTPIYFSTSILQEAGTYTCALGG